MHSARNIVPAALYTRVLRKMRKRMSSLFFLRAANPIHQISASIHSITTVWDTFCREAAQRLLCERHPDGAGRSSISRAGAVQPARPVVTDFYTRVSCCTEKNRMGTFFSFIIIIITSQSMPCLQMLIAANYPLNIPSTAWRATASISRGGLPRAKR